MAGTSEGRPVVLVIPGPGTPLDDLRQSLEAASFDVFDARAPGDASPDAGGPDVVVADLEAVPSVDPGLRGLPIVALVRRTSPEDVDRARELGALDVLAVPLVAAEVSIRVGAAARLAAAEARLATRDRELRAWADQAGHDVKGPLAVISGMAETLETAWERLPADDRDRLVGAIRNQAARATGMVDEALAVARRGGPAAIGGAGPRP